MNQETKASSIKKMAIVPWSEAYFGDRIFDLSSEVNSRDNVGMVFVKLKKQIEDQGWMIHTIDQYTSLGFLDAVVFFNFNIAWYRKISEAGLRNRTIYMAWEPPVVDQNHSARGIKTLLHYFNYILTWNDGLVDHKQIWKFMYPYDIIFEQSKVPFREKELLVNISGNKTSDIKNELYSERKKVIKHFDGKEGFALYGPGWDHKQFQSYRGMAKSKKEVYHRFRFALSLENMKNIDGYITEKILDCFSAGIVPIYQGAQNIDRYIPSNCYIAYSQFGTLNDMEKTLLDMTEEQYLKYLKAAAAFLQSEKAQVFSAEKLADTLMNLCDKRGFQVRSTWPLVIYQIGLHSRILLGQARRRFHSCSTKNRGC